MVTPLFLLILCIVVAIIAVIALIRLRLGKRLKVVSCKIESFTPYCARFGRVQDVDSATSAEENRHIDIPTDISRCFSGRFISSYEKTEFTNYYSDLYREVQAECAKLKVLFVKPNDSVTEFLEAFENIPNFVKCHNEDVIRRLLKDNKEFFDSCLTYPLDKQQRRAIVSGEDNCLVVSSAGSGKTSSIIGKVKYLTEVVGVNPERILLISYTNKAACELTERINTKGLRGYTFHKLALDIIVHHTHIKPSICDNTDAIFDEIFHELLKDETFVTNVLDYFLGSQLEENEDETQKEDERTKLTTPKETKIKSDFLDMDGKAAYVKSEQEKTICSALFSLGVRFRYEEPYEHNLADETHPQYRPDFSIYYTSAGKEKRIYLEHFGIDEHGDVPRWFAEDKNLTYEEANKQYNDGIAWKIAAHKKYGTKLLILRSADFRYTNVRQKLKTMLTAEGVSVHEVDFNVMRSMVLPEKSKQEKAFIRLIVTFITLVKSSGKSINDAWNKAKKAHDKRSAFVIKEIFTPAYELYAAELQNRGQIDFTDAILQATQICKATHPVEYDYIIVDEFQDISVDRYNFLKVLRQGNPPAKLFCVGDDWQSIYRFSGSDMSLFNQFSDYFGATEINKIETTYRFGEPLISLSSKFIQCNSTQLRKNIHPFKQDAKTELKFYPYTKVDYNNLIAMLIASIPADKSIFFLGRYSFDDYEFSKAYKMVREGSKFFYLIGDRRIEFLTAHKSKGLEADYVILLQCNDDTYGFPTKINDDPVLNYVLTNSDDYPFGEERRLFYVAITRAKKMTFVLYDREHPSAFVEEFLHPDKKEKASRHTPMRNANKWWTKGEERFMLQLYKEGKSIKEIADKMGRSQTGVAYRLKKFGITPKGFNI